MIDCTRKSVGPITGKRPPQESTRPLQSNSCGSSDISRRQNLSTPMNKLFTPVGPEFLRENWYLTAILSLVGLAHLVIGYYRFHLGSSIDAGTHVVMASLVIVSFVRRRPFSFLFLIIANVVKGVAEFTVVGHRLTYHQSLPPISAIHLLVVAITIGCCVAMFIETMDKLRKQNETECPSIIATSYGATPKPPRKNTPFSGLKEGSLLYEEEILKRDFVNP